MTFATAVDPADLSGALTPPPYQVGRARLVLIGVHFDPEAVAAVLPAGLRAVAGAPGIINSFVAENSYPFGPFSGFYLSVDVEGHVGPDGSTGRHMFAAAHGPQAGPARMMRAGIGFPSRPGGASFANSSVGTRVTAGVGGERYLDAAVTVGSTVIRQRGSFVYPVADRATGRIVRRLVPWVGDWADAELHTADLTAPAFDDFGRVPVRSYDWAAELSNCTFALAVSAGSDG